ncbi:MAG TPA: hypothetical protein VFG84_06915 [Gemmatimonadaceae bacterium]|nr:hypothetical protein [Gemmatimonadaceae bacterium]
MPLPFLTMSINALHLTGSRAIATLALLSAVAGCSNAPEPGVDSANAADAALARARQDSTNRAMPGYVIDSILPMEEELRRFRTNLPRVSHLEGGSGSRDALLQRFVNAVSERDTSELRRMALTRAEFAWLVFGSSPYAVEPLRTKPGLIWTQMQLASNTGATRLFERSGGRPFTAGGLICREEVEVQGDNRIWAGCVVRRAGSDGVATDERLFGSIIERDGQFKFMTYANAF